MPLGLEKLKFTTKRNIWLFSIPLAMLYVFQPTSQAVSWIMEYKIDEFPLFSVRNIIAVILLFLWVAIKFMQV